MRIETKVVEEKRHI